MSSTTLSSTTSSPTVFFSNLGEIDPRLITIMGTNVKEGDSPIGTFGTGLKYAVAVILRLGGNIVIEAGQNRMTFRQVPEDIRGKTFGLIYMDTVLADGAEATQQLGFTTELGKNWEPWMAFRELYCNTLDEPGARVGLVSNAMPVPLVSGRTNIYVGCAEIVAAYLDRSRWFLFGGAKAPLKPLDASAGVELYPYRGDNAYFYRGIKVGEYTHRPRFTYNFLSKLDLTEDRTCHEVHTYYLLAPEVYSNLRSPNVLADIIIQKDDELSMESALPWSSCYATPSETLLTLLREKRKTQRSLLPKALMSRAATYLPQDPPAGVYLTDLQTETIERAKAFLLRIGIEIKRKVVVLESLGGNTSGLISSDTLYIALAVVEAGPKEVAANLLTEWLINEQDLYPNSHDMTNWLVHKVLSQAEELHNTLV